MKNKKNSSGEATFMKELFSQFQLNVSLCWESLQDFSDTWQAAFYI